MSALTPTASQTADTRPVGLAGWLARDGNAFLVGAAALYVVLYLLFWPRIYTTMDESAYMGTAWALRHGTIYPDAAGISTVMSYQVGPHIITQYPPGMPLVLAFVSLFGWNTVLGTNLVILLALFAATVKLLRMLRLPAVFAVLMLLHPTAVTYSRTVMSDLLSGLLLTTAFLCYLNRRYALVGILVGLTVLIRTASGIALPLFLLAMFFEPSLVEGQAAPTFWGRVRNAAITVAAALPFIAFAWWYQHDLQEGGWAKYSGNGQMGLQHVVRQLTGFSLALLVLYPGILVSPAFYRGRGRVALWILTYGLILFYCFYHFQDSTDSKLQTFILGQRYVLSVMPLYIAAYAALIWRFAEKWNRRLVVTAGVLATLALFAIAAVAHRTHDRYLARGVEVRSIAARIIGPKDHLFANVHLAKILHPIWTGPRRYQEFGDIVHISGEPALFAAINAELEEASKSGGRVLIARWSRKYRPETEAERQIVERVRAAFETVPLDESQPPNDFDEVEFLQVIAPRPSGASRAGNTAGEESRPAARE